MMRREVMNPDGAIEVPAWLVEMQSKLLYALRVHPNCEKKVVRGLGLRGVDHYFPTMPQGRVITQRSRWNNAERRIERRFIVPVFPGLLFVPPWVADHGSSLREVDGVVGLLRFGDWVATLNDEWANKLINAVMLANVPRSKRALLFKAGDVVRIVDGPFRGFSATFDGLDSRGRLSVVMSIFGRLQPLPLTVEQIEPV